MRLLILLLCLFVGSAGADGYWRGSTTPMTGGTISGVGKETTGSDTDPRDTNIGGANAYPQATVNTTGGTLSLSPGSGRRFVTVVDYSLIDAGVDTITLTINGTANVGTEGANDATHWKAETSNAATATNICTWAAQLAGVSATASGSSCYITADASTYSVTLATSMTAGEGTVTSGTDGALVIYGGSGTNTIDNVTIGATTAAAATVTALTATGAVALSPASANVVLSPTGTGVVTINPATAGTMNNVVIGGTTAAAGTFTTLTASSNLSTAKLSESTTAGRGLTIAGGTAVTDVNALNITQTLNEASTAFTAIKLNVTDTASAAGSLLMDLQTGGASQLSLRKDGFFTTSYSRFGGVAIHSDVEAVSNVAPAIFASSNNAVHYLMALVGTAGNVSGPTLSLLKTRSIGSTSADSPVVDGDYLGSLNFYGADGASYRIGASIDARVDGTPGASDMPGRLIFSTTPDGSAAVVERMSINNAGIVLFGTAAEPQAQVTRTASAVNYLQITGGATTAGPTVSSQGETNVPLNLTSKGTGTVSLNATGSGSLTFGSGVVAPAASGTRYLCISTTGVVTSSAAACSGT